MMFRIVVNALYVFINLYKFLKLLHHQRERERKRERDLVDYFGMMGVEDEIVYCKCWFKVTLPIK